MPKSKGHRLNSEINAGSMADIAFLLLIFFLVTTQIDIDKGILVKLPMWEVNPPTDQLPARNVFSIKVNAANQLLIEGEMGVVDGLKNQVKEFIMNPLKKNTLADAPNKAVVSLQNDRGTAYETYVSVYNEIKSAYNELWNEESQRRYGELFVALPESAQNEIKSKIPLVISESEPTEF